MLQTSQKDKNDRIPFTLTFHPHNQAVKSIILNNFKLLQNDPETGRIFSQPPLISFKRNKNVGNFLVRSALKTNEQPSTFKWVLLKAGLRPSGLRPAMACDGPAARRSGGPVALSSFSTVFCPAVNPHACTDLHRVWACKMDDGEFEFVYHFNHLNPCFCLLL